MASIRLRRCTRAISAASSLTVDLTCQPTRSVNTSCGTMAHMTAPTAPRIHHLTLTVSDVARSAAWYQALLGPAILVERQGPTWTRMRMQWPSGLIIGVTAHQATTSEKFDETRVGMDHVGLGCADENAVRGWHARMESLGVEHGPLEDAPSGWAVTARDPDGIPIEFFCVK